MLGSEGSRASIRVPSKPNFRTIVHTVAEIWRFTPHPHRDSIWIPSNLWFLVLQWRHNVPIKMKFDSEEHIVGTFTVLYARLLHDRRRCVGMTAREINLKFGMWSYHTGFAATQWCLRFLIMAAHSNGQAIILRSCDYYLSSPFFLAYSQWLEIGCLPYLHTWCGVSANLECMSEMFCTRLAENTWRKNYAKIAICAPPHNLSGWIFATEACIDNRKKIVKRQYLLHMFSKYGKLRPLTAEIGCQLWGTPANFYGFRVLASLLHRGRSTEVNQTLHDVWPSPGLVLYIHFAGSCPLRNFATCKIHFASKFCVFLYWQGYCTTLEQWASAKLRRSEDGATYIRQGGHNVGHRPTF